MKQIIILIALIFSSAIFSSVVAQQTPPAVTGDKDLRDTDIKRRSVDMERVERDAKKTGKTPANSETAKTEEDRLAAKYDAIKTDYEQIQLSQDAVIKSYQSGAQVDYAQISKSAVEINESAKRLNSNIFTALKIEKSDTKKEKNAEKETRPSKSVRDLIVDLDNTIGSFATSPMFQNLREVDAAVAEKAREDLEKIIELSALLDIGARKMKATEK